MPACHPDATWDGGGVLAKAQTSTVDVQTLGVPVFGSGSEAPPDYHELARHLADLSRLVAARAAADGDGRLEETAVRIGDCAAAMMRDLHRRRA